MHIIVKVIMLLLVCIHCKHATQIEKRSFEGGEVLHLHYVSRHKALLLTAKGTWEASVFAKGWRRLGRWEPYLSCLFRKTPTGNWTIPVLILERVHSFRNFHLFLEGLTWVIACTPVALAYSKPISGHPQECYVSLSLSLVSGHSGSSLVSVTQTWHKHLKDGGT